jgi:hypothetical protein
LGEREIGLRSAKPSIIAKLIAKPKHHREAESLSDERERK